MAKLPKLTRRIVGPPIRRTLTSRDPIDAGSFSGAVRTLLASRFLIPVVSAEADELAFASVTIVDDDAWLDLRPATLLGFLQPAQYAADELVVVAASIVENDDWIPLRATAIGPQPVVVFTDTDEGVQLTDFGRDDLYLTLNATKPVGVPVPVWVDQDELFFAAAVTIVDDDNGLVFSPWTLRCSPIVYTDSDDLPIAATPFGLDDDPWQDPGTTKLASSRLVYTDGGLATTTTTIRLRPIAPIMSARRRNKKRR